MSRTAAPAIGNTGNAPEKGQRRPGRTGRRFTFGRVVLIAGMLAVLGGWAPAAAQTRADSAAVLLETARQLADEGRSDVAEALYRHILERYGDTSAAQQAAERLRAGMRGTGRVELQVWGTLYGLWLGVAVPLAAGADGPEPYGFGLLLGGPAGFFGSRAYARARALGEGQARAITLGGTWGTWQGLGWALAADVGVQRRTVCPDPQRPDDCFTTEEGETTDEVITAMIAGGLAGIATGAIIAARPVSRGTATTVNFGALWGTWFGIAGALLFDVEGDDPLLRAALIGGNAGLLTTGLLAPGWNLTRERARLISIAGVLGGLAGAGIDLIAQPNDEQLVVAIPLAGSIAGLALGALTTRDRTAEPPSQTRDRDAVPVPLPALIPVRDAAGDRRLAPGIVLGIRF